MGVSGNSNGNQGALGDQNILARTRMKLGDNKETVVSGGALSSLTGLILPCELHSSH